MARNEWRAVVFWVFAFTHKILVNFANEPEKDDEGKYLILQSKFTYKLVMRNRIEFREDFVKAEKIGARIIYQFFKPRDNNTIKLSFKKINARNLHDLLYTAINAYIHINLLDDINFHNCSWYHMRWVLLMSKQNAGVNE